ncbi:MAG TPA: EAL domain-containing protein [Steroidobacteraceae bacterium]|nr:EAL domain-containing protein [Steroidobacteraceae bacterium]
MSYGETTIARLMDVAEPGAPVARDGPAHRPGAGGMQKEPRVPIDAVALRYALERNEINAHYQPQVDLQTDQVCGVEALARWHHPHFGRVAPEQFIALAESDGLIHELTRAIMGQALREVATANAAGHALSVSLNLSPVLLESAELAEELGALAQLHGVPCEHITLEITERAMLPELAVALGVLTRLRLRGFGLSLDDYGTGRSSLRQLTRIPFSEIKLDHSLVQGAHQHGEQRTRLRAAIQIADELGLRTVAEGVEDFRDRQLIRHYGCARAQGWLFKAALSCAELMEWLPACRGRHAAG